MLAKLPLVNLTKLTVHSIHLAPREWLNLFTEAVGIREISYNGSNRTLNFLYALVIGEEGLDSEPSAVAPTSPNIPLPQLNRLEFSCLDFGRDGDTDEQLMRCLETRRDAGLKLEKLMLKECRKLDRGRVVDFTSFDVATEIDWDEFEDVENSDEAFTPPCMYDIPSPFSDPGDFDYIYGSDYCEHPINHQLSHSRFIGTILLLMPCVGIIFM